ncbi:MAG: hypothetical protein ACLUNZ_00020 [Evtepia sp.]
MRKRNVDRKAVLQQMMALAAGRANDAVTGVSAGRGAGDPERAGPGVPHRVLSAAATGPWR